MKLIIEVDTKNRGCFYCPYCVERDWVWNDCVRDDDEEEFYGFYCKRHKKNLSKGYDSTDGRVNIPDWCTLKKEE